MASPQASYFPVVKEFKPGLLGSEMGYEEGGQMSLHCLFIYLIWTHTHAHTMSYIIVYHETVYNYR